MFQRDPRAGAFLGGDRVSGQDIRDQNGTHPRTVFVCRGRTELTSDRVSVLAAQSIANIVKSSLGPLGLDKMLVDNIGVCGIAPGVICALIYFFYRWASRK